MDLKILLTCIVIILARVTDVSLGTLRTVCIVNGRRGVASVLGFIEVLVWILVVSRVLSNIAEVPAYAVSYAIGFALGNFLGITVEQRLAFGEYVVRIFTRNGPEVAVKLRGLGYRVTQFEGQGRDGLIHLLFVGTPRKDAGRVAALARSLDPDCFYVIDDVRALSSRALSTTEPSLFIRK